MLACSPYTLSAQVISSTMSTIAGPLLDEIKQAARCNDARTIEILFTKACDGSALGNDAARFLLALCSGEEAASTELIVQLGKDSLEFCGIVTDRNRGRSADDQWKIPAEILVMAGFEADADSQRCNDVVQEIKKQEMFCALIEEREIDASLFGLTREISSGEVNSVSARLNRETQSTQFCDARKVTAEACEAGRVEQAILTSLQLSSGAITCANHERFIPLLMDDHWFLFGLTTNTAGEKSAVVFSSLETVKPHQRQYLSELAKVAGVPESNVSMITEDLQQNVPNACGLFVTRAMERIAEHSKERAHSASAALREFVTSFQNLSPEMQSLFNRCGRLSIFGQVIERSRE